MTIKPEDINAASLKRYREALGLNPLDFGKLFSSPRWKVLAYESKRTRMRSETKTRYARVFNELGAEDALRDKRAESKRAREAAKSGPRLVAAKTPKGTGATVPGPTEAAAKLLEDEAAALEAKAKRLRESARELRALGGAA